MNIEQRIWTAEDGWTIKTLQPVAEQADLVFIFGGTGAINQPGLVNEIRAIYPGAFLFGCSTAGEICGVRVYDNSLVATAVAFETTTVKGASVPCESLEESFSAGAILAGKLPQDGLRHVFVLSEGLRVNGSELIRGINSVMPQGIGITGGLAADSDRFRETSVIMNGPAVPGCIAAIGLYGSGLKIGYGSRGGWDSFGPERLVTRSRGNVLYEMDGRSALDLYRTYLGNHARDLPAAAMLFPLSVRGRDSKTNLVRTILSIDEAENSMTFAGDIPEGTYVRFMKANFDRLIDGAISAAETSRESVEDPALSILITCVGRKLVLKQRTEEEVEGVQDILGADVVMTGFYSYGEICPHAHGMRPSLHNQTMTITTFTEA